MKNIIRLILVLVSIYLSVQIFKTAKNNTIQAKQEYLNSNK